MTTSAAEVNIIRLVPGDEIEFYLAGLARAFGTPEGIQLGDLTIFDLSGLDRSVADQFRREMTRALRGDRTIEGQVLRAGRGGVDYRYRTPNNDDLVLRNRDERYRDAFDGVDLTTGEISIRDFFAGVEVLPPGHNIFDVCAPKLEGEKE